MSDLLHYAPSVAAYEDSSGYCGADLGTGEYTDKVYAVTCRSCLRQLVDDAEVAKLRLSNLDELDRKAYEARKPPMYTNSAGGVSVDFLTSLYKVRYSTPHPSHED